MDKSLLFGSNVIIQGITGKQGSFHAKEMLESGAHIVAGVSPNKSINDVHGVPVYDSIAAIKKQHTVDTSVIFVPAPYAKTAIFEAIDQDVPLIICITEGIPIHDMILIKQKLSRSSSRLIGPNSPGILLPGRHRLGIIPHRLSLPGSVAIVSRSGTLTYEVMAGLTKRGIGQRYVIGIGGDPIKGASFTESLELFNNDPEVSQIVLVGEIGGGEEIKAAEYIKSHVRKPVYGYIAGHSAPPGVQLGHAGAILGSDEESAEAKTAALRSSGVTMFVGVQELINHVPAPHGVI